MHIVIPLASRVNFTQIAKYLRDNEGFVGSVDDIITAWLSNETGLSKAQNDMWIPYLRAELEFGPELVVNGTFDTDTTGWDEPRSASTLSAVSGVGRTTADSTTTFGIAQTITDLMVGITYQINFDVSVGTVDGTVLARYDESTPALASDVNQGTFTSDGHYVVEFTATATQLHIGLIVFGHTAGGVYAGIDNASVRKVRTLNNSFNDLFSKWKTTLD